jgi:hypothetical protein
MQEIRKYFDLGSLAVIIVTFILFTAALFSKGLTHDIFLEAGVFLVSVKLIIMLFKNETTMRSIHKKLDDLQNGVKRLESHGEKNEGA